MEKSLVERIIEQRVQRAAEYDEIQCTLYQLLKLDPEQLIEKLEQGWQLTPPNNNESEKLFEQMAELGTAEANIHPDGDKYILACPRCGSGEYLYNEDGNQNEFCGQCGQKLEWGEEKDR